LRELDVSFRIYEGRVEPDPPRGLHKSASFYVGETAAGGLLGRLTEGGYSPANATGYAKSVSDDSDPLRFRRTYGSGWVALSPEMKILMMLTQGQAESSAPPAQIRIHFGSISESKLAGTLRALAYMRARRLSGANALLLEELLQQFHLTPPETLAAAEEHHQGRLVCPLGGRYTWNPRTPIAAWSGTAWSQPSLYDETQVPADYQLPLIDQLRRADVSLQLATDGIDAHIEIDFKMD
jgi:hypothetical protein